MADYTRVLYPSKEDRSEVEDEIRFFILLAIKQARDDVIFGITDNASTPSEKPMIRADAMTFFTDGRYEDYLEMAGVSTTDYPAGVGLWVSRLTHYLRSNGLTPSGLSDKKLINYSLLSGALLDPDIWSNARELYYDDVQSSQIEQIVDSYDGVIGNVTMTKRDWAKVYKRFTKGYRIQVKGKRTLVPWMWGKYAFVDKFPPPALIKTEWYGQMELQYEDIGVLSERSITRLGKEFFRRLAS